MRKVVMHFSYEDYSFPCESRNDFLNGEESIQVYDLGAETRLRYVSLLY